MTRICLLGPESVGKSRLAQGLAEHFDAALMPEYGRYFDIQRKQQPGGPGKGAGWSEADLLEVAQTHIAMREAIAEDANPVMIEDTDILQTAIWAEYLLGAPSPALEQMIATADLADYYLVLSPDVDWRDDGVRYAGDAQTRRWFFDRAVQRLRTLGLPHDLIAGAPWQERTARALALVEGRLGAL